MITAAIIGLLLQTRQELWPDVLRDAQITTRTLQAHGHCVVELVYTPPKSIGDKDIVVEAEVSWSDENYLAKFRFQSDYDYPFGRSYKLPIETSPWEYILRTPTEVLISNASSEIVEIRPANRVLDISPTGFSPLGCLVLLLSSKTKTFQALGEHDRPSDNFTG